MPRGASDAIGQARALKHVRGIIAAATLEGGTGRLRRSMRSRNSAGANRTREERPGFSHIVSTPTILNKICRLVSKRDQAPGQFHY